MSKVVYSGDVATERWYLRTFVHFYKLYSVHCKSAYQKVVCRDDVFMTFSKISFIMCIPAYLIRYFRCN